MVVDAELEAGRAPLDEIERRLGLQGRDGGGAVARHDVAAVQQGNGHVFAGARVADDHLVVRLEALQGQVVDLEGLMGGLLGGDDGGVGDERVVDAREGDEVGLEFVEVDVEGAIEAE